MKQHDKQKHASIKEENRLFSRKLCNGEGILPGLPASGLRSDFSEVVSMTGVTGTGCGCGTATGVGEEGAMAFIGGEFGAGS